MLSGWMTTYLIIKWGRWWEEQGTPAEYGSMATAEREAEARAEGPLGSGAAPNRTGPQRSGELLFLYRVSLLNSSSG